MTGSLPPTAMCLCHVILTLYSLRCIQVVAGVLGRAGEAGQKLRLAAAAKGDITYRPAWGLVMPGSEEKQNESTAAVMNQRTSRTGRESAPSDDIMSTDELATKLDEVSNHEDHRVKGGRQLKASS
jgi:small subunit ribosomal protein S2